MVNTVGYKKELFGQFCSSIQEKYLHIWPCDFVGAVVKEANIIAHLKNGLTVIFLIYK